MKKTINKIIDYCVFVSDPDTIFLFGSFALGNTTVYSDIDLLIITSHTYNRRELEQQLMTFSQELGMRTDILVRSQNEFEQDCKNARSFIATVVKGAEIVYKKSSIPL